LIEPPKSDISRKNNHLGDEIKEILRGYFGDNPPTFQKTKTSGAKSKSPFFYDDNVYFPCADLKAWTFYHRESTAGLNVSATIKELGVNSNLISWRIGKGSKVVTSQRFHVMSLQDYHALMSN
jgi:hypothetical protein